MIRSTERMITTHVGSLPRPEGWIETVRSAQRDGRTEDPALLERTRETVAEIVRAQVDRGIDVVTDGEVAKPSFLTYVNERLGGFKEREQSGQVAWAGSKERADFGAFYDDQDKRNPNPSTSAVHMVCTAPITYVGQELVRRDIDNLKAAMARYGVEEAFLPAISPTNIAAWQSNEHYASDEEFLFAIAEGMSEEYRTIVESGLLLQIDDPGLVTQYAASDWTVAQCRTWAETRVEAINHALRGIPSDRVRFHTCYSVNMGPRVHDMELRDIVDLILKIRAGAYSFEAANPRHEHEWRIWKDVDLPADKILIPGVITNSSVLVEHPDTVAERIVRFAGVVGRERVIAGADCGFATFAGANDIHPTVAWAKLEALAEGARRATAQLWS